MVWLFKKFNIFKEFNYFLSHSAFFLLFDISEMPLINELNLVEFISNSKKYFLLVLMKLWVKNEKIDNSGNFIVESDMKLMMDLTLMKKSRCVFLDRTSIFDRLIPLFELNFIKTIAVLLFHMIEFFMATVNKSIIFKTWFQIYITLHNFLQIRSYHQIG